MVYETITLDCEGFGFLDLDVMYEEVVDDHSFDHEWGTEERVDKYVVIYSVKFNEQQMTLTAEQIKNLEDFITEHYL